MCGYLAPQVLGVASADGRSPRTARRSAVHFTPRDQIILLAGLQPTPQRKRIWALRDLSARLAVLRDAGLVDSSGLCDPAGVDAARRIRYITLDDLLAEHLPSVRVTG